MIKNLLPKYYRILEKNEMPSYIKCKHISVDFNKKDSIDKLWHIHDQAIEKQKIKEKPPEQSLLDLKTFLAEKIFEKCRFCERKCQVDRTKNTGVCQVKEPHIASEFLHIGEEPVLIPSYTIFFSGCTFNCVFCQNWDISQKIKGYYIHPDKLAEKIENKKQRGAKNVNWVGGDPTPNLPYILKTLQKSDVYLPQIWNSNMYCSYETMKLLNQVIDLYLTDFKYGNDECAKKLSKVEKYTKILQRNHKTAYQNGDIVVRHLVMPNHVECCSKPIMKWISNHISDSVVNIMSQYRPEYNAKDYEDISRSVNRQEVKQVKRYAKKQGVHQTQ
ncbi:MAG: radical SAM protein [Candidatus Thermoplasmatota archaeon]